MTNNEWRSSQVFGGKERMLEWVTSPRRRALEQVTSGYARSLLRVMSSIPAGATPPTKRAPRSGGRKRLAKEKQRFYMIGRSVDQMFPRLESAFRLLKELRITSANSDPNTLKNELLKRKINYQEIDAVLQAKTPMGAAKRFVGKSLTSRAHPNGISLQTVNSCYSRYLKALKSKPPLL
jgi:hypothetical protein